MATEVPDFEVDSEGEYLLTTDSEGDGADTDEARLLFREEDSHAKAPWYARIFHRRSGNKQSALSVQSGDIVRTPTPTDQSSAAQQNEEDTDNPKSGFYKSLFPVVHFLAKGVFFSSKCPIVPFFLLLVNVAVVAALAGISFGLFTPSVNFNIESFQIPDHPAQIHWDSFQAAISGAIGNSAAAANNDEFFNNGDNQAKSLRKFDLNLKKSLERALSSRKTSPNDCEYSNPTPQTRMHSNWYMDIVYRVPLGKQDRNILSESRLRYIHEIEQHIFTLPEYKDFCHRSPSTHYCDRPTSLLSWLYPTNDDGSYVYNTIDGFTPDLTASLLSLKSNLSIALWFTGGQVTLADDNSHVSGSLLRSQLRIGLPLPCYQVVSDRYDEQHDKVNQFFISLIPYLESVSNNEVEVLYGGNSVFDYQIESAIIHDAKLAIASGLMILILIFSLSGFSVWSTICGVYAILSCFPFAFFAYRVILQIESIGLLNVISLFVIIGIGVDDVFVFLNTFKQSASLRGLDTIHKRLTHTIISAGKATFFTSVTTAVAFFANAISSIPAVKQFGLFMGLVVLFCYIQVSIVVPLFLHIYHCCLLPCENLCYRPLMLLCCGRRRLPSDLPAVRYNAIELSEDDDSGIDILGNQNSAESSERSSTGSTESDSNVVAFPSTGTGMEPRPNSESDSNVTRPNTTGTGMGPPSQNVRSGVENEDQTQNADVEERNSATFLLHNRTSVELQEVAGTTVIVSDSETVLMPVSTPAAKKRKETAETHLTYLLQVFMVKFVARVVMFPRTFKPRCFENNTDNDDDNDNNKFSVGDVLRFFWRYSFVWVYVAIFVSAFTAMCFLKPTESPPQIFNANTNIQKMLNLEGNLTEYNCVTCYKTYNGENIPTVRPPQQPTPTAHTNPPPSHITSTASHATDPPITDPPITDHSITTSQVTTAPPITTHRQTTHPFTTIPTTTIPTTNPTTRAAHTTAPTLPPTVSDSTPAPTKPSGNGNGSSGPSHVQQSSRFSNNVVVYVVFGLAGVERKYDPSHVLPEEGEGDYAVLDEGFHGNFTCPRPPGSVSLTGTVRALCRLCANLSRPDNGLVLPGNAQCFPPSLSTHLRCLIGDLSLVTSCLPKDISANASVPAKLSVATNNDNSLSLLYLAMAFRSTTYLGSSPFSSIKDYQKWEAFLASELDEIRQQSGEGEIYEGAAELISTAFQTSETWVEINVEMAAVYGSIYGILISVILCLIVVVILSHDWRIVVSMFLTIFAILTTLLALFRIFGWKIGIVEAISLSILVGNSLDYCIHLTEGYISTDSRHLAFVERFKFAAGASERVKRVISSIAFIGVSIVSSALTTVLATIPLLGTHIQLFTRFGQILLLDTLIAILYTLVFCSTFLSFFGPTRFKFTVWKFVNAFLTISVTFSGVAVLVLGVYIATRAGVSILSPDGGVLFQ